MTPLISIMAALAAIEQAARFGQTTQGQRIIQDLLDGGAKVEDLIGKLVGVFTHLFHHDTTPTPAVKT
jgi:hypothetical protein